jgi:hypothetical protein
LKTEKQGAGENCVLRRLMICIPHQILSAGSNQEERNGRGMCREWERGEVLSRFWWGILRKRDPLKYLYLEYNIKIDLKEIGFEDIVLIDLVQGK